VRVVLSRAEGPALRRCRIGASIRRFKAPAQKDLHSDDQILKKITIIKIIKIKLINELNQIIQLRSNNVVLVQEIGSGISNFLD